MPYIKQEYREVVEEPLSDLFDKVMCTPTQDRPGVITYCIYKLFMDMNTNHFVAFAILLGILDSVGKEFYRQVVAPYEDEKIQQNGDVK